MTVGWILFRAQNLKTGLQMIRSMFAACNPWVLFDDSLFRMGLSQKEWEVFFLSVLVLIFVSYAQERGVKLCQWFQGQNLVIRWSIYLCAMKRFVKCFFELLTQNFSARRETGRKRGAKRACERLEAVFVGR